MDILHSSEKPYVQVIETRHLDRKAITYFPCKKCLRYLGNGKKNFTESVMFKNSSLIFLQGKLIFTETIFTQVSSIIHYHFNFLMHFI